MPKCKHKNVPDNAVFCPWCGRRLIDEDGVLKVPQPRKLPSGTYFAQLTVGKQRVSVSAPTEKEYYAKARALKAGLIELKKTAPKMTVGAAIDEFIKSNSRVLSPSTIKAYKSIRKHRFQSVMDKDINASINWQKVVNDEFDGISAKTVANAWRLITASLAAQGATAPSVALPKIPKSSRPWLDYEQIQAFLAALEGQDCELAALLALHGLRRSEMFNLTSKDVDLKKKLIHVRGASVYNDKGEWISKDTNKNASSARDVHIVIPRLETLLQAADGLLLTCKPNTPYVQINRLCASVGLPEVGIHGLRHSFASLAYHLGWSEATTMREGGWSTSKTVHEIYTHLAAQDVNADIAKMQAFYAAKNPRKTRLISNFGNKKTNAEKKV